MAKSKPAQVEETIGILKGPYEPFYNNPVPKGTECVITSEDEDRYVVKFPGLVGYSGSFHIKKSAVELK